MYGALVSRGENISLFIKRRCVDTQTKYWVPAEEGTSVDLQRFRTIDRAAEAAAHQEQISKARAARRQVNEDRATGKIHGGKTDGHSHGHSTTTANSNSASTEPAKEKSGFGSKLKKLFS